MSYIDEYRKRELPGRLPGWLNIGPIRTMKDNQDSFVEILQPSHGYFLSDVRLEMPNAKTAIFKATLNGPEASTVWARAWLSTEAGTLAESASPELKAGDEVTLEVTLGGPPSAQFAYMRIESAPLRTEHVVGRKAL